MAATGRPRALLVELQQLLLLRGNEGDRIDGDQAPRHSKRFGITKRRATSSFLDFRSRAMYVLLALIPFF